MAGKLDMIYPLICYRREYDFTDEQRRNADVNGDGVINVLDATHIQKYLVGLVEI